MCITNRSSSPCSYNISVYIIEYPYNKNSAQLLTFVSLHTGNMKIKKQSLCTGTFSITFILMRLCLCYFQIARSNYYNRLISLSSKYIVFSSVHSKSNCTPTSNFI